jgi:hypothetical protein
MSLTDAGSDWTFKELTFVALSIVAATIVGLALSSWIDRMAWNRQCDRYVAAGLLQTGPESNKTGQMICFAERTKSAN